MKIKYLYGFFLIFSLLFNNAYAADYLSYLSLNTENDNVKIDINTIMDILSNKELLYTQKQENFKNYIISIENIYGDRTFDEILEKTDDEGNNALHLCIKNADIEACHILLTNFYTEDEKIFLFLTKNKNGCTPIDLLPDWAKQLTFWQQIYLTSEYYTKLDLAKKEQALKIIREDCEQNPELECNFNNRNINGPATSIKFCPKDQKIMQDNMRFFDDLREKGQISSFSGFGSSVYFNSYFMDEWKRLIENNNFGNFLDVGCGHGPNVHCPSDFCGTYYANDLNKKGLFNIMLKWPKESLHNLWISNENCLSDNFALPNNSFDGIIASHLFHYFDGEECDKALDKFFVMLKPGAKLILVAFSIFYSDFLPKDCVWDFVASRWPGVFSAEKREKLKIKKMKQGFILSFLVERLKEHGFDIEDAYYFDSLNPNSSLYSDPFASDETLNWLNRETLKPNINSLKCSIGIIAKKPL